MHEILIDNVALLVLGGVALLGAVASVVLLLRERRSTAGWRRPGR